MEFEEFIILAAKFIIEEDVEEMAKELREAFRLYDKEGNGFIPTSCLKEILKELDDQLTNQDLDMMIEEIDSDGSGWFLSLLNLHYFRTEELNIKIIKFQEPLILMVSKISKI